MQIWSDENKRSAEMISGGNCKLGWVVLVSRFLTDSEVTLIKQRLATYLAELEFAKQSSFPCTEVASSVPEVVQTICDELKVFRGHANDPAGRPPNIAIEYA
jgi:hypothetical protein